MTSKWDLSFIYKGSDDPEINENLEQANRIAEELEKYRGKIKKAEISANELLELFKSVEKIFTLLSRAQGFASLLFSQETTNDEFKALLAKVEQSSVEISNKMIWMNLELNDMTEEQIRRYLEDPILEYYHHFIKVRRLSKPYLLSESVEQVLSKKSLVGSDAWGKFYAEYTAAFQFEIEIHDEIKTLSQGEIRPLFRDPDPVIRENAFKAYYQKYAKESIAINHCFNNIWKDHGQNIALRKYPDTMTPAHLRNQLPDDKIIQTMMNVVRNNYSLVQDYYKAKAKLLNQGNKIKGSDLYAPIGKAIKYSWDEAKEIVIDAYTEFDQEIGELSKRFFERNLVDSEIRKAKRTGAFCAGLSPELDPLILMSYNGTPDSISTLAHEMGHGLHDMFSGRKQTLFYYHPPLVAAETASVFGEQILINKLMKTMTDEEAKLKLLGSQVEDAILTISRQTMYIFFEKECHETGSQKNLSNKEMSEIWNNYVNEAYGDAVEFLPEQSWNWASIPHFINSRFYCYAYSFGMLFVLGLYQKYLEEGKTFIPKYKALLEAGGSRFPVDLAASVGLDITEESFWQAGFDYLNNLLREFQELVDKRL